MRASAGGIQTPADQLAAMQSEIVAANQRVSMVTADFDVPLNNARGPESLNDIAPSLDVAEAFQCDLIRICMKQSSDIAKAQRAADEAAERNIRLAHQCHTTSMFEQVDRMLEILQAIDRPNFGVIYEPANLMLCGESYGIDTLRRLQPYLMNVYVQNHRLDDDGPESLETWCRGERRFHHIPLWESGGVDFSSVFEALDAIDYEGYFTIHQAFAHLMGPEEAAAKSADYVRSAAP